MNIFGRREPSDVETKEADRIKKSITQSLATSLKVFQRQYATTQEEPIYSGETANAVCQAIEAVFLHGLKTSITSSVTSKLSTLLASSNSDQIPQLSFWSFLCKYTHKDLISQLSRLGQITTEIGMCRAWVRIALNDCVLESYLDAMLADEEPLHNHYRRISYLRDHEQVGILKSYIQGLSSYKFQLSYNSSHLNTWSQEPMMLAGLWSPPQTPTAVLSSNADSFSSKSSASPQSSPITVKSRSSRSKKRPSSSSSDGTLPNPPDNTPCDVAQISDKNMEDIRKLVLKESLHRSGFPSDSTPEKELPIDVPPNTPYDISTLAAMDVADLCQLNVGGNPEGIASSVDSYGSHISHPDFTDWREDKFQRKTSDVSLDSPDKPVVSKSVSSSSSEPLSSPTAESPCQPPDTREKSMLTELGNWVLSGIKKAPPLLPIVSNASVSSGLSYLSRTDSDVSDSVFPARKESVSIYDSGKTMTCESSDAPFGNEPSVQGENKEDVGYSYHSERSLGNSLGMMSGWSSSFEPEFTAEVRDSDRKEEKLAVESVERDFSFNSLVRNYSSATENNGGAGLEGIMDESTTQEDNLVSSASTLVGSEISPDLDSYEVLPTTRVDARTQELMSLLCLICTEKGLDSQSYQCKTCHRPIGIIYGKPRVCTYDGGYYCYDCHNDDDYYIPSRILHNWDFRKHKVSVACKEFLSKVEQEPLINIDKYNPRLYQHVPEMEEVRVLRQQLRFLKSYLFTCSQSVADEFRKKIWPKEYMYEDLQVYSLSDLLHVHSGHLAQHLKKIKKYATKHVYECGLCQQKGFICEICDSAKVIYPFETESTTQCLKCKSVFHKHCKTDFRPCPKCERRRRRSSTQSECPEVVDYAFMPED